MRWRLEKGSAPLSAKWDITTSPAENPPLANLTRPFTGQSRDSLVPPLPVDGLLDAPLLSPDVSVLARIPLRAMCEAYNVFLVGDFTAPLGEDANQRHDTGGIL